MSAGRDEALGPALQVRRRDHDRHYRHRPEEREEEDGAGRPPAPPSTRAAGHGSELVGLAGAEGHPNHVLVGLGDEELASAPPYCDRRRAQKQGGCRALWCDSVFFVSEPWPPPPASPLCSLARCWVCFAAHWRVDADLELVNRGQHRREACSV